MSGQKLTCSDVDLLLADYVDQNLQDREVSFLKDHFSTCPTCAALAADAAAAVSFMDRAAVVEAPTELVNKILFEISNGPNRSIVKPSPGRRVLGKLFGKWLEPVLQPRLAMGMAMTMLSFGMLLHVEGVSNITAADLNPVNIWSAAEDKAARVWDRGVKRYQNLKVVFEIQSRYAEWAEQQAQAAKTGSGKSEPATSEPGTAEKNQNQQ